MMKQDIKNKEFREKQKYVSPSVKAITTSVQRVICTSVYDYEDPFGDSEPL